MKKILIIAIIFSLVFSGFFIPPTKKVEAAGWPVFDAIGNALSAASKVILEKQVGGTSPLLTGAAWAGRKLIKRALRDVTTSVVKWIDSGFKGNPAFLNQPDKFLQNSLDVTVGDMLIDTGLDFLCDPFKLQVKIALGLQYRPFKEQIACSFSTVQGNVADAMKNFSSGDFINGGGWDSWLQMTTIPQNNQMGALILSQNELNARIEGNKNMQLAEASWGSGFLSYKDCVTTEVRTGKTDGDNSEYEEGVGGVTTNTEAYSRGGLAHASTTNGQLGRSNYYDDQGNVIGTVQEKEECTIKTPGSEIMTGLGWAQSSSIREMELANDIDAIFNALANMALKKGADYFSSVIKKKKTTESTAYEDNMAYISGLQAQLATEQGVTSNSYYSADGNINLAQDFSSKATALNAVEAQIAIESNYRDAQIDIYNLLDKTESEFESSDCSSAIKTEISAQVSGDYSAGVVRDTTLTRNMTELTNNKNIAINNINLLNRAWTAVSSSDLSDPTSLKAAITESTTGLALHPKASVASYSQPSGTFFVQVKDWVEAKINTNGSSCGIQKSAFSDWGIEE